MEINEKVSENDALKSENDALKKEVAELKKLIPQPDPDWKAICEKCHDGEIEPHHCKYYGEPNGFVMSPVTK